MITRKPRCRPPRTRVRSPTRAVLNMFVEDSIARAQRAVEIARELDDAPLLARALTACDTSPAPTTTRMRPGLLRRGARFGPRAGRPGILSRILAWQSSTAISAGDPTTARVVGEEGRLIADAIGDALNSRQCRVDIGWAQLIEGDVTEPFPSSARCPSSASNPTTKTSGCSPLWGSEYRLRTTVSRMPHVPRQRMSLRAPPTLASTSSGWATRVGASEPSGR